MASSDPDEDEEDVYEILLDVLVNPEEGKQRLPRVVGMFDSEDRDDRCAAAWTCCLVANHLEDEETIEYLVRRLSDRLDEEHVSLELTTALDYISTRYSEQVERILAEMDEEERERGDIPLPTVGNFTRSNYYSRDTNRDGVGRTRVAGSGGTSSDQRVAVSDDEPEPDREGGSDGPDLDDIEEDEEDEGDETGGGPKAQERTEVTSIATRSRFDKLHILAAGERSRYADVYEALVGRAGGEEEAVALRLLRQPSGNSETFEFQRRVGEALQLWVAVDDHDHVVTVLDSGVDPRPWLTAPFAGDDLTDIDRPTPMQALDDALNLADAVSYIHKHNVVHGGLDPGNVLYPGDIVDRGKGGAPYVDNVALLNAYRFHFNPSLYLDPRFAAPEYFSDDYGRIDHTTDIYQLGAVLYYLFTGTPPYSGQFEQVRENVLGEQPPEPSSVVDDVPEGIDSVVTKAMAKQKLTRYEAVEHLEQDLVGIRGGV